MFWKNQTKSLREGRQGFIPRNKIKKAVVLTCSTKQ